MNKILVYISVLWIVNLVSCYQHYQRKNVLFTKFRRGLRLRKFLQTKDLMERENNLEILRQRNVSN